MAAPVLYLVVQLGGDRYAIEAAEVTEIVPLLRLKALPGAPVGTAGLMNYRGVVVPVVDLELLTSGVPTTATGSARIVVVHYLPDGGGGAESLGLLVPAANDTIRLDPDSFVHGGMRADGAAYLGAVFATPEGVVQRVGVKALLSPELRAALHRRGEAA
jgi:Chemotaxis signal transduction protein